MLDACWERAKWTGGDWTAGLDCALSAFLSRLVPLLAFCLFTFIALPDADSSHLHLTAIVVLSPLRPGGPFHDALWFIFPPPSRLPYSSPP